jgi:hypothetical protein
MVGSDYYLLVLDSSLGVGWNDAGSYLCIDGEGTGHAGGSLAEGYQK